VPPVRKAGAALLGGFGMVLAILWFGAVGLVEIGGISYRKDCVTAEGTIKKDWTFSWFTPIPFVFRPSQEGCQVHTGVRVAMNAVGLFPYKEYSASQAARDAASDPDLDANQQYFAALYADLNDMKTWNAKHPEDMRGGIAVLNKTADAIDELTPPETVATEHHRLVALFRSSAKTGGEIVTAFEQNDRATIQRLSPELEGANARQVRLLNAISRKLRVSEEP
jgi:hypothetical protein